MDQFYTLAGLGVLIAGIGVFVWGIRKMTWLLMWLFPNWTCDKQCTLVDGIKPLCLTRHRNCPIRKVLPS